MMMKNIQIEWRHLDIDGSTCERCGDTGNEVEQAVAVLNQECAAQGITFDLIETRLEAGALNESNAILIDGHYLETLLPQAGRGDSHCKSCSDLTGDEVECRTIELAGKRHETVPASLIREAACQVVDCCNSQCC
jgi:hypothetical protein